jgi:hypothetical protein
MIIFVFVVNISMTWDAKKINLTSDSALVDVLSYTTVRRQNEPDADARDYWNIKKEKYGDRRFLIYQHAGIFDYSYFINDPMRKQESNARFCLVVLSYIIMQQNSASEKAWRSW